MSIPMASRGVIFMALCSSLFRQFEFIQQQWMNYGLDFEAGNDTCPLIGSRATIDQARHPEPARPTAPRSSPAICPSSSTTRGGDYFFLPSLTAIRMIAMGTVDPT